MRVMIDEMNTIIQHTMPIVSDHSLSQWSMFVNNKTVPEFLKEFIPEGITVRTLIDVPENDDVQVLRMAFEPLFDDQNTSVWIKGTFHASEEPEYQMLNERFGWQTILFTKLFLLHRQIPLETLPLRDAFIARLPILIYSSSPDAIDVTAFRDLWTRLSVYSSAMLLRLGLSWVSNRAMRLWSAIPNAMMLVSSEHAFEANERVYEWFDIEPISKRGCLLNEFLPFDIANWVRDVIQNNENGTHITRIFTMHQRNGNIIHAEVTLYPYRPLENIVFHNTMTIGYGSLSPDQADRQLHLLLIRDISSQWEAEKLQQEFELARRMQIGLLPTELPKFDYCEVSAACRPASEIGGDLYDVRQLPDGRLAILLCDAAGHGVDSALLAAMVTGAYRAAVYHNPSPQYVLTSIDQALRASSQPGFATAIYLVIERNGRSLQYGLAGHYPPMIIGHHQLIDPETPSSLPLGIGLAPCYYFRRERLESGTIIALFSDGLMETRDNCEITFEAQLHDIVLQNREQSPWSIMNIVMDSVILFRGNRAQEDDLTAVVVKIR